MIGVCGVIENDLYDVSARVKEIDPAYFIVRNYKTGKFELHVKGQRGSSLALTLPYPRLDARTVEYVRRTRSERAKELFLEAERENEKLLKTETEKIIKKVTRDL